LTRPQKLLRAAAAFAAPGAAAAGALLGAGADETNAAAPPRPTGPRDVAISHTCLNVVSGRRATVAGRAGKAASGRTVRLQRRDGKGWRTIDRARVAADGTFAFRFRPSEPGSAAVRVHAGAARERVGRLNVYRRTQVSWYGPGLYGGRLGCGGTLTPSTVGVANRTLPCGSKVTLRHGRRTVRVPVVDRGPYVGDREFDLTAATRAKLRFSGVGSILVAD
jgi:rare lipoprotein A